MSVGLQSFGVAEERRPPCRLATALGCSLSPVLPPLAWEEVGSGSRKTEGFVPVNEFSPLAFRAAQRAE